MPRIKKGRYSEPTDLSGLIAKKIAEAPVSDVSIDGLIQDGLSALYREIKALLTMSASGKLTPNDARDLRDHLKLLFEMRDAERGDLSNLTDEQLMVKALSKQDVPT